MPPKVLFISAVPTHPTNAGNRVRILRMAGMLTEAGWEVYFALIGTNPSFHEPMRQYWGDRLYYLEPPRPDTRLPGRVLRKAKEWLKADLLLRRVLYAGRHGVDAAFRPDMDHFIRNLARQKTYQAVVAEYAVMSRALTHFSPGTRKFVDTHDVFTNRDLKFAGRDVPGKNVFSLSAREEAKGLARADVVIAIQENEKRFFETIFPGKIAVVGHVVDVKPPAAPSGEEPALLFVGSRHEANLVGIRYFIREILPLIRERVSKVTVLIAGRVCERLEAIDDCIKLGEVDDLAPLYDRADVVINPVMVGTGLKIKNLEALGRGKPLVTTSVGAEGLEAGAGIAFLVGDTPGDFAAGVVNFLADRQKRLAFSAEALKFARLYNGRVRQEFLALFT